MPTAHRSAAVPQANFSLCEIVWRDSGRMAGVPCFTGTRVSITALFDCLEAGDSILEFTEDFPGVSHEQIVGALYHGNSALLRSGVAP